MNVNPTATRMARIIEPSDYAGTAEDVAVNTNAIIQSAIDGHVTGIAAAITLLRMLEDHGPYLPAKLNTDLAYIARSLIA